MRPGHGDTTAPPKRSTSRSMPRSSEKSRNVRSRPASPSRARSAGSPTSRASACASASRSRGAHEQPRDAVLDQLRDAGHVGSDARQALALRFHQHVGQAVAVAVARHARRQHEHIGGAIAREHVRLGERAEPRHALRDAERPRFLLEALQLRPATYVFEAPIEHRGQPGQRGQEVVVALLLHRAAHREDDDRARVARRGGGLRVRWRKALRIDAVVDEVDPRGVRRRVSADAPRSPACTWSPRRTKRASRASPTRAWSRCPSRAPRRSRAARASSRRSG